MRLFANYEYVLLTYAQCGNLMAGPLATTCHLFVLSASSAERNMLMEVITSMFSSISDGNFDLDDPISLMLEVTTRTHRHLMDVRRTVTTMQSRMETLSQGAWRGRAEIDLLKLKISGAQFSERKTSNSFGTLLAAWLQKNWSVNIATSEPLPTGDSNLNHNSTFIRMGSNLSWEWYLSWLHGEESLLREIQ
jgi:hypothetical protein